MGSGVQAFKGWMQGSVCLVHGSSEPAEPPVWLGGLDGPAA